MDGARRAEETSAFRLEAAGRSIGARWEEPPSPVAAAAVAHGAGAGMDHPFMAGVAAGLVDGGVAALRFNFPYIEEGRRAPDRPPLLLDAWRAALQETGRRADGLPVVAGGKSLGGRMASLLAAEEGDRWPARGLVFFGYPLHAPGRPDQLRDAHLAAVRVPILFIQGTRDALARFDLVQEVVARLEPRATIHPVAGGDHSFRVPGSRRPADEIGAELGAVAARFIRDEVA